MFRAGVNEAATIRPEMGLLLACARTQIDGEAAERIGSLLRGPIDWEVVLATAYQHGVSPLLYWNLNRAGRSLVPGRVLARLRGEFHLQARRNILLAEETVRLLETLRKCAVSAIPFKGALLSAFAYGNLALRSFGDLDFIVHPRDYVQAEQAVLAEGYRRGHRVPQGHGQTAALRSRYHRGFVRDDLCIEVELHWRIVERHFCVTLAPDLFWADQISVPLLGTSVPSLGPSDLLVVLCVHGAKHYWEQLKWICDVAEVIRSSPSVAWPEVLHRASRLRVKRLVCVGVLLATDMLGAPLPADARGMLQADPAARTLVAWVKQRLASSAAAGLSLVNKLWFRIRCREDFRDCAAHLWYRLCELMTRA